MRLTEMARAGYFLCIDQCGKPTELKDVDDTFQRCAVCGGRVRWIPPAITGETATKPTHEPRRRQATLP